MHSLAACIDFGISVTEKSSVAQFLVFAAAVTLSR